MNVPKVDIKQLLEAGVHLGHKTLRWNPKMKKYIFGEKNSIHIIDLTQTVDFLLAGTLLFGAVIGAQIGTRFGGMLRGEQLRGMLAIIVLLVSIRIGFELISIPLDIFSSEIVK